MLRRFLVVSLGAAFLAVAGGAVAQQAVFIDVLGAHRGVLGEPGRLHAVLADLGALPEGNAPTVVYIQSVDSRYTRSSDLYSSDTSPYEARMELIAAAAEEFGGPAPVFVATQWGTPEGREAYASTMAAATPIFPTTAEELTATGYDWLVEADGFVVRWDHKGAIPEFTASTQVVAGVEWVNPVEIALCVDQERILGWARGRRDYEATDAAIGRFTRECLRGELELPDPLVLSDEFLERYGLGGKYFAIVMPYAYADAVPVETGVARAESLLAQSSAEVPLLVVAASTLSVDGTRIMQSQQHAADLAQMGVETDPALNAAVPDWVQGFVRHAATTLVLFDETGSPVAAFVASPSNPAGQSTLSHALVRYGLF